MSTILRTTVPTTLWFALLAPTLLAAEASLPAGAQLAYRGSVAPQREDRSFGEPQKTFDLTLLVAPGGGADGRQVYWTIEERGRGAWPWVERFGSFSVDAKGQADARLGPALLYDLGESTSAIALPQPWLTADEPLAAGLMWSREPWNYHVTRAGKLDGQDAWQVQVSNNYGPKRTLWVAKDNPVALGVNERVFMGMGQEFELQLRHVGREQLDAAKLSSLTSGFDALIALRSKLNLPGRKDALELTPKQLALLVEQLPAVEKGLEQAAAGSTLEKIVRSARRDLGQQNDRAGAIDKLIAEQLGRTVPDFDAEGLSRETLTQAGLKGQVTVLHFWDYRDEPLKEPYGQTGYLDFLSQKRKTEGVKVYGVAVDGRLAEEPTRSQALRGIRKLKAFMNLSYPILLDGGSLIKKFGDPRLVGAELPLFVVIDRQGKIVHYRVGHYEVDRNEGLKDLNAAVSAAAK